MCEPTPIVAPQPIAPKPSEKLARTASESGRGFVLTPVPAAAALMLNCRGRTASRECRNEMAPYSGARNPPAGDRGASIHPEAPSPFPEKDYAVPGIADLLSIENSYCHLFRHRVKSIALSLLQICSHDGKTTERRWPSVSKNDPF